VGENELSTKNQIQLFLFKKFSQLESDRDYVQKKMDQTTEDLAACRIHVQQLESKNKALQCEVEAEQKQVQQLEDDMDALNARVADQNTTSEQKSAELQQQHAKLVAQLRDQMAQKNGQIAELTVCKPIGFILSQILGYINFFL
jgi:predicted RNase H-like nuclease (RuvC/YqgF family)